jgi:hypothetical protein
MTDPTTDLRERLIYRAEQWEKGRYGDRGLRLAAEDTAKLLREAAALLVSPEAVSMQVVSGPPSAVWAVIRGRAIAIQNED